MVGGTFSMCPHKQTEARGLGTKGKCIARCFRDISSISAADVLSPRDLGTETWLIRPTYKETTNSSHQPIRL